MIWFPWRTLHETTVGDQGRSRRCVSGLPWDVRASIQEKGLTRRTLCLVPLYEVHLLEESPSAVVQSYPRKGVVVWSGLPVTPPTYGKDKVQRGQEILDGRRSRVSSKIVLRSVVRRVPLQASHHGRQKSWVFVLDNLPGSGEVEGVVEAPGSQDLVTEETRNQPDLRGWT